MGLIYFTEKGGITSTSANFLANLAKETIRELEQSLKGLTFVDTSVELISGERKTLKRKVVELDSLESTLNRISSMYAFCAWMREAIKEKERLQEEANNYSIEKYCLENNIPVPERPDNPDVVDEDDIIAEMSIKERNRYLTIETFAATYGKYIHPDGYIAQAREEVHRKIATPTSISGSGRDLLIYTYEPSCTSEDLEKTFISLQGKQREYEKQLNALKFKIKEEINRRNIQLRDEFQAAYNEFRTQYALVSAEAEKERIRRVEEVSKLKIVVPDELQDTYQYLETLVK